MWSCRATLGRHEVRQLRVPSAAGVTRDAARTEVLADQRHFGRKLDGNDVIGDQSASRLEAVEQRPPGAAARTSAASFRHALVEYSA